MKLRLFITGLAVLYLLPTLLFPAEAQRRRPASARKLSLEEEAQQEAEKYWHGVLARCGDSYLTKEFYGWSGPGSQPPSARGYEVYEFKGLAVVVHGQRIDQPPLSQADILNGVRRQGPGMEYDGKSYLRYSVARNGTHSEGDLPGKLHWWPWEDARGQIYMRLQRVVRFEKTDGIWKFHRGGYSNMPLIRVPVKCDLSDVETAGTTNP